MYQRKLEEDIRCPLEYGMSLIGGKWKSRIVCLLGNIGPMHYGEVKSDLINIKDGVLASTLNELIESELIEKTGAEHTASFYRITPKGETLLPIFREMCRWSIPYYKSSNGLIMGHCRQCEFYKKWSEKLDEERV